MLERFSVQLDPHGLPAVGTEAAAVLMWRQAVWAARLEPEPGTDVVVAVLNGQVEVIGVVRHGPGWPGRQVTTYE